MSRSLLQKYIELTLETRLARVPSQLLPSDGESEDGDETCEQENVNEFSGVGAVAGYGVPLGMNPDKLGRKKNSPKKR